MIPKIIHYCWFGKGQKPELADKCISSWKRFLPDYEIKEWNEENYPVEECCDYVKEAYKEKKWAFVSDYVRFDILYRYGGIYFDTDVEVIKPIDDILEQGAFIGGETIVDSIKDAGKGAVKKSGMTAAPGLGMAANPGLGIYKEMIESYQKSHFLNDDGTLNKTTIVARMTDILSKHGFRINDLSIQKVDGIYIYPPEYFAPFVYHTGEMIITENTRTIHHYMASWKTPEEMKMKEIGLRLEKRFGVKAGRGISKIVNIPFRIQMKLKKHGLKGAFLLLYRHYFKHGKREN